MTEKIKKMWALTAVLSLCINDIIFAQSGVNGLNTATTSLKTYIAPVTNITLVIGGIVGIVGAVRVYSKWNSGDQDIWQRYGSDHNLGGGQRTRGFCPQQGHA